MTVLFSTDCESYAAAATLPGWALAAGAGMTVRNGVTVSYPVAGGLMGYGSNSADDSSVYTSSGLIGDQALRTDAKGLAIASGLPNFVGHLLRSSANGAQSYRVALEANGSAVRVALYRYQSGSTLIGSSAYAFTPATSDIAHLESRAVGSTIEVRLWLNAEARPSTPTLTVTDATFATGYPGLRCLPGGGWRLTDNIVVTDAAGGEDFFDAPPSGSPDATAPGATLTGTSTIAGGAATGGTAGLAPGATLTGTSTISGGGATGGGSGATLVTYPFVNNTELTDPVLYANQVNVIVDIYNPSTGVQIVRMTGQTTNSAGVASLTDAALAGVTSYRYWAEFEDGEFGTDVKATS